MSEIKTLEIDDEMRFFANKDIVARSPVGTYIYLLVWLAIIIPNSFYLIAPNITILFSLALLCLAIIRTLLAKNFESIYRKSPILWKVYFFSIVWATALLWGILCYMGFTDSRFDTISLSLIISIAGFAGGGTPAFISDRVLTVGLLNALLLPTGILLFFNPLFSDVTVILLFFIYWLAMYSITKIQHKEYWRSLKNTFLSKRQAVFLERLNTIDALTGLNNRSYFDTSLHENTEKTLKLESNLSLLFIDIDHFKVINDTYGHLVGDECLIQFAGLLNKLIKFEGNIAARYGGEEFAVILPFYNHQKALTLAEQIRQSVENFKFHSKSEKISFTVSIGVATTIPDPSDLDKHLIGMADKAVYQAKEFGRNRVVDQNGLIYLDNK